MRDQSCHLELMAPHCPTIETPTNDFNDGDDAKESRVFGVDGLKLHPELERVVLGREGTLEELGRSGLRVAELQVSVPAERPLLLPRLELTGE